MRLIKTVTINLIVLASLLLAIEFVFRAFPTLTFKQAAPNPIALRAAPYLMYKGLPHHRMGSWSNGFTGETIRTTITTNNEGYNDQRDFHFSQNYQKQADEKVVVLLGGSTAWGVGSTSWDHTIAGRMQHHLNGLQSKYKYSVINLAMGGGIAYQEFLSLELWGSGFHPDWIVSMNGHNDAGVGCAYSQGVMNPLFFPIMKSYIDGYLDQRHTSLVFYRGWLENELIRRSAAYRSLTGKTYVENNQLLEQADEDKSGNFFRKVIVPTKLGEARGMLAFYLKATDAALKLHPEAKYMLSTQPLANSFTGEFTDAYESDDPDVHRAAVAKRESDLEQYLTHHQDETCTTSNYAPSFTYVFVKSAFALERLAQKLRNQGRHVEYHNVGRAFPNERAERLPYFIDSAHVSDLGADVLGRFYAERILATDATGTH